MTATELISLLDGRASYDVEAVAQLQQIIDDQGVEAAKFYWLHGAGGDRPGIYIIGHTLANN